MSSKRLVSYTEVPTQIAATINRHETSNWDTLIKQIPQTCTFVNGHPGVLLVLITEIKPERQTLPQPCRY